MKRGDEKRAVRFENEWEKVRNSMRTDDGQKTCDSVRPHYRLIAGSKISAGHKRYTHALKMNEACIKCAMRANGLIDNSQKYVYEHGNFDGMEYRLSQIGADSAMAQGGIGNTYSNCALQGQIESILDPL